jgi:hypothetical protein
MLEVELAAQTSSTSIIICIFLIRALPESSEVEELLLGVETCQHGYQISPTIDSSSG